MLCPQRETFKHNWMVWCKYLTLYWNLEMRHWSVQRIKFLNVSNLILDIKRHQFITCFSWQPYITSNDPCWCLRLVFCNETWFYFHVGMNKRKEIPIQYERKPSQAKMQSTCVDIHFNWNFGTISNWQLWNNMNLYI